MRYKLNDIAREAGYFLNVGKFVDGQFTIDIGGGFSHTDGKEKNYLIVYDDEFCTLFEKKDGGYVQKVKRDISSEIRSGTKSEEFMENLKKSLVQRLCSEYNIDKSYVYFEESN